MAHADWLADRRSELELLGRSDGAQMFLAFERQIVLRAKWMRDAGAPEDEIKVWETACAKEVRRLAKGE